MVLYVESRFWNVDESDIIRNISGELSAICPMATFCVHAHAPYACAHFIPHDNSVIFPDQKRYTERTVPQHTHWYPTGVSTRLENGT